MKAEDTVMNPRQIQDEFTSWAAFTEKYQENGAWQVAKAQAEISFKIGKTAGVAESLIPSLKAIEASRKAGIKEVVEWVKTHSFESEGNKWAVSLWDKEWQAKVKEWGIEK